MIPISSLHGIHKDRPAAILGGGPSLPGDMVRLPADCLLIAANDHAIRIGVEPDYMFFFDSPEFSPDFLRLVNEWRGGLRVTDSLKYTDVDLRGVPRPDARSGVLSAWFAMFLGCDPILLCGMDLYIGEQKYCHPLYEYLENSPIFDEPLENHIKAWRTLEKYPGASRIRAMSGPLTGSFGAYP